MNLTQYLMLTNQYLDLMMGNVHYTNTICWCSLNNEVEE